MSHAARAYLGGGLADHARGRTLEATFRAVAAAPTLPAAGALFVLGKEFQAGGEDTVAWLEWARVPGRVLIVVPPFDRRPCETPAEWEARTTEPLAGGKTVLGKILARELRHEIRGQLLPLERGAGQVITAGWRKHPASGLVVITALPVWSLSALDHGAACTAWLADLIRQSGKAPDTVLGGLDSPTKTQRAPSQDEWTLLLHLCTGPFPTEQTALDALAQSAIHRLPRESAVAAMKGLSELQLAESGALTDLGERTLLGGPYAAYAEALRRLG